MMGNVLYDHLQSGGGLVMCCYAYLAENQLAGKWTSHFYPMPSSSFGSPEPQARTVPHILSCACLSSALPLVAPQRR
jgi:hypothetical protein